MKAGDIYKYSPANRWCRHGMAVVYVGSDGQLRAVDTYWRGIGGDSYDDTGEVAVEKLEPQNLIGNVGDFKKVHREDYEKYADADRLWIPIGGGSEAFYVRNGALIDQTTAIEYLREQIRQRRSDINCAEYRIRNLEKEISEIETRTDLKGRDPVQAPPEVTGA